MKFPPSDDEGEAGASGKILEVSGGDGWDLKGCVRRRVDLSW
jgi:hypothetical protein